MRLPLLAQVRAQGAVLAWAQAPGAVGSPNIARAAATL